MKQVCCVCGTVYGEKEGPEDQETHGYCAKHLAELMAAIKKMKQRKSQQIQEACCR